MAPQDSQSLLVVELVKSQAWRGSLLLPGIPPIDTSHVMNGAGYYLLEYYVEVRSKAQFHFQHCITFEGNFATERTSHLKGNVK